MNDLLLSSCCEFEFVLWKESGLTQCQQHHATFTAEISYGQTLEMGMDVRAVAMHD